MSQHTPGPWSQMDAPWIWAAQWDDGQYEVEVLPYWKVMRRRDLAQGLGGPRRILVGKVRKSLGAEKMIALAKERLGVA